jgi:glutamine synthetase
MPIGCVGLDQALDALHADREFLTPSGVFTDSMLDAYFELKTGDPQRYRKAVHLVEVEMYCSL